MLRPLLLSSRLREYLLRFFYSCPHLFNFLLEKIGKRGLIVKQGQSRRLRGVMIGPIDSNADLLRYIHLLERLLRDDLSLHLNNKKYFTNKNIRLMHSFQRLSINITVSIVYNQNVVFELLQSLYLQHRGVDADHSLHSLLLYSH